jgi:hypothetical protein
MQVARNHIGQMCVGFKASDLTIGENRRPTVVRPWWLPTKAPAVMGLTFACGK